MWLAGDHEKILTIQNQSSETNNWCDLINRFNLIFACI